MTTNEAAERLPHPFGRPARPADVAEVEAALDVASALMVELLAALVAEGKIARLDADRYLPDFRRMRSNLGEMAGLVR